jgi:two-component system NarL family response regulator
MPPAAILRVDDHPLGRLGLALYLRRDPRYEIVAEASNGQEAVAAHQRIRPDLVLMDVMMPVMNGIDATRLIRQSDPQARVVILSGSDGEEHIYRALRAGASGYLLKDAPEQQVGECLAAVMGGRRFLPAAISARLAAGVAGDRLSPREQDILRHLSKGLGNKLIARATGIAEGTVKCHVRNIFSKMGVSTRTEAVRVAMKRGLVDLSA